MNKDKKDGYHEYFHENRNLKARGHYVDGMKTGEWQYFDEEGNYSHGFVALGKQSGQILDDLKKYEAEALEEEPKQKYLWKDLPMPEPKPTEIVDFGVWDVLKFLFRVGATIALLRLIVEYIF